MSYNVWTKYLHQRKAMANCAYNRKVIIYIKVKGRRYMREVAMVVRFTLTTSRVSAVRFVAVAWITWEARRPIPLSSPPSAGLFI